MFQELIFLIQTKESASLENMTMTVISVIPELGLEQEEKTLTTTRVERSKDCHGIKLKPNAIKCMA